jgi:serine/threonine protein kinase/formylglycine-generating enzyme required for sulfatase activity
LDPPRETPGVPPELDSTAPGPDPDRPGLAARSDRWHAPTEPVAPGAGAAAGQEMASTVSRSDGDGSATDTFPPRPRGDAAGGLIGPYLLVERIDAGSQGEVWRALQTRPLSRLVALKVLPRSRVLDHRRVERLRKEAQRGGQLHHPSILPIYDFGEQDGQAYVAMRLVDGFSLGRVIHQRREALAGRPPAALHRLAVLPREAYREAALRLLVDVARALQSSHDARIIHRDVKPSNILLGREPEERAYLADFGLARDLDDVTQDGAISEPGTLIYMPPERLRCEGGYDEVRAEVFSLGVTIDEALTLDRPLKVPEDLPRTDWAAHLARSEVQRPRTLDPTMPRDLEAILLKATDREPSVRYGSVGELADDLERFLRGEPVRARPPGPIRRAGRRLARHRAALVVAAALAVAAGALVAARAAVGLRAAGLRDEAVARLDAGRPAEAAEPAHAAIGLDPDSPEAADLARRVAEALVEEARNSPDHDVRALAHRWLLRWQALTPEDPRPGIRLASLGVRPVAIATRPGGAVVTLRPLAPDGRPRVLGPPAYEVRTPADGGMAELPSVLPGAYWATAVVPGSDAFVERPLTLRGAADLRERLEPVDLRPRRHAAASGARPMVRIAGGTLRMGINSPQFPEAMPPHLVEVPEFLLDPAEVTNAEFAAFLEAEGRQAEAQALWPGAGRPGVEEGALPVVGVPETLAVEYAAWRGCRLPTEAELEWAARGPKGQEVPAEYPDSINEPGELAALYPDVARLHPVGSFPLDRVDHAGVPVFGLFANAGEWTLFRFRPYGGYLDPVYGPDSDAWRGQVVRCGLYRDVAASEDMILGFIRRAALPATSANPTVGFRCARSIRPWIESQTLPGAARKE